MALVIRYFSTTSAGAADGTTWADRAALFSAGVWSSVITGFNFTGGDSLVARIGPGSYTCSQSLATGVFTSGAPAIGRFLILEAADSSGDALAHPDPDWVSAQPAWDDSSMPVIATATNVATLEAGFIESKLLKFTASAVNGWIVSGSILHSCVLVHSGNMGSGRGLTNGNAFGCVIKMTGTQWDYATNSGCHNTRLEGNPSASSNNRNGNAGGTMTKSTAYGFVGYAFLASSTGGAVDSVFVGGSYGIYNNHASNLKLVRNCVIVGAANWGVATAAAASMTITNCRLRNNTSGAITATSTGEAIELSNDTTSGTDADEFVDAANRDYRIKYGSAYWGKGIGAGDGPATIVG